jgi:diguanylate cyclase (GGDEF)-like protein
MPVARRFAPLRAFSRLSLRTNLILLLAVAVAILVVDRGREATRMRADAIARASSDVHVAAQSGAERQAEVLSEAKALLRMAVELPAPGTGNASACHKSFKRVNDEVPWLISLAVFGLDGFPICTSDDELVRKSFADRSYFREALATGDFALSDYIIGRVTGKPIVVVALPRMRNGVAETVLIAAIDLAWMSAIAAETGSSLSAEVLLIDKGSTVLAAYPDPAARVGRNLEEQSEFISALQKADASGSLMSVDGKTYIVGHAPLSDTKAVLAVMLPLDAVIAEANQQARYEIGKILLAGILSFLVIWLGGELLVVRPIKSLARGAVLLGSGDLTARIPTEGLAPELRRLGESFNAMAVQLREREDELRSANERLSDLASKDALTGIANRRGFDEQCAAEWNRAKRAGEPLALLVIDVDHFKRFNDRYGHLAGDACLQRVAASISGIARRAGDLAARTGGEEFALLLPATDLDQAAKIAESVRLEVEAMNIAHKSSPEARVTVSVGAAASRADRGGSMLSLIDSADAALYRAKRAGRNCVVLDSPAIPLARQA